MEGGESQVHCRALWEGQVNYILTQQISSTTFPLLTFKKLLSVLIYSKYIAVIFSLLRWEFDGAKITVDESLSFVTQTVGDCVNTRQVSRFD